MQEAWKKLVDGSSGGVAGAVDGSESMNILLAQMDQLNPYKLGTLTLNEESEHNKGLEIIPTVPSKARPNLNPKFGDHPEL